MTYVVTEKCIKCKYQDCVEVCPVDAFFEGAAMVVIAPDICIDCGVCENECPAGAILPDKMVEARWTQLNARFAKVWPNIRTKGRPNWDADAFVEVEGKFEQFFSEEPGKGG